MVNVKTPKFRVSYPNVFKTRHNEMNGKDEYSIVALFPKGADLSPLKKAAQEALVEKLGSDRKKWPKNLRSPFRDQKEKGKEDEESGKLILPPGHEEGAIFLSLKSTQKPGLVDQKVADIADETQFYAGCWAIATIRPYFYDVKGNKGVSFGLGNIQKVADGDPLGNRTRATDDFEPVEMEEIAASSGGDSAEDDIW